MSLQKTENPLQPPMTFHVQLKSSLHGSLSAIALHPIQDTSARIRTRRLGIRDPVLCIRATESAHTLQCRTERNDREVEARHLKETTQRSHILPVAIRRISFMVRCLQERC